MITGNPIFFAVLRAVSSEATAPSLPGTTGTLLRFMTCLAFALSPPSLMDSGDGPMNVIPDVRHASAKWGFSDRKPYPGCIASESVISAEVRMLGILL